MTLPIQRRLLLAAESIAIAMLLLLIALFACAAEARAAGAPAALPVFTTPDEMRSGGLLLRGTEEGRFVEAPRLGTDIDLTVSGPTMRARLTQVFHNPTKGWVEGVYVYPLPEGAAVDSMTMVIGERVVVADIKKREEAKAIYEEAKASGQKAALVEQQRPNIFTNSIANIGPGETVLVAIEYQEPVHQTADRFSLRLPLVVAPRYNPGPAVVQSVDFGAGEAKGWGKVVDPVPDREAITPPVLDPRLGDPVNPVSIRIRLDAGFPIGSVTSAYHKVAVDAPTPESRIVTLAAGPVPADRDFELAWTPADGKAPSVGLFKEHLGSSDYMLAFVTPPPLSQAASETRPREITFVIDNSGSMGGTSMDQAKASLAYALGRLKPQDRFNVIRFDDTMDALYPDTVSADPEHVEAAKAFVARLEAAGGTEMVPPMKAALVDPRPGDGRYLRQVIFLTDGEIGNEQQLFDVIAAGRGRSRVFMVGIGSAPNSFLMTRAAEVGRGTFTLIGSAAEVEDRMKGLFEKLESPVVTNLSASLPGGADVTPKILPDLYRGEPMVIAARLAKPGGEVEIKGMIGDRPWIVRLPLAGAAEGAGLSKLWARRKIDDAEVGRTLGTIGAEDADRAILALALEHRLVTRLTSLVAVDKTASRPADAPFSRADLPVNLPAGWDFDKLFGRSGESNGPRLPEGQRKASAEARPQLAAADLTGIAQASAPIDPAGKPRAVALPQTATDAELRLYAGLAMLTLALAMILLGRRRQAAA